MLGAALLIAIVAIAAGRDDVTPFQRVTQDPARFGDRAVRVTGRIAVRLRRRGHAAGARRTQGRRPHGALSGSDSSTGRRWSAATMGGGVLADDTPL
jgi:hypothetical protein